MVNRKLAVPGANPGRVTLRGRDALAWHVCVVRVPQHLTCALHATYTTRRVHTQSRRGQVRAGPAHDTAPLG